MALSYDFPAPINILLGGFLSGYLNSYPLNRTSTNAKFVQPPYLFYIYFTFQKVITQRLFCVSRFLAPGQIIELLGLWKFVKQSHSTVPVEPDFGFNFDLAKMESLHKSRGKNDSPETRG